VASVAGAEIQESAYVSEYSVEILATNGPAPSRVRLTFDKNLHVYQDAAKPTPIDGKTYVVEAALPAVRDANGAPVTSEEETQRVLDVFPDLGTRTQVDQVLPDAAMAIGETRHELAAAILGVIHPRAWTLSRGTAVLVRVDRADPKSDVAVFEVTLDATARSGVRMDVSGEARVRLRDARLVSVTLEGTYSSPSDVADPLKEGEAAPGKFVLRRVVRDL
jgi:hypothetical protein